MYMYVISRRAVASDRTSTVCDHLRRNSSSVSETCYNTSDAGSGNDATLLCGGISGRSNQLYLSSLPPGMTTLTDLTSGHDHSNRPYLRGGSP